MSYSFYTGVQLEIQYFDKEGRTHTVTNLHRSIDLPMAATISEGNTLRMFPDLTDYKVKLIQWHVGKENSKRVIVLESIRLSSLKEAHEVKVRLKGLGWKDW